MTSWYLYLHSCSCIHTTALPISKDFTAHLLMGWTRTRILWTRTRLGLGGYRTRNWPGTEVTGIGIGSDSD
ncbi:hypothetical protein HOLleu_17670 [Holothuria leucospilota]|uniref:Uncharacterized protein n=1 Tax=Holothuria leucospilota TaxID=206669 RepID=A0A9Q1C248_HOLLE|nr:hypothetical protein HOLleu_17670 [Holothuria leucospilota]